jgi:catechol 2,3-dioxygenase-like lactoylglutathione lyase family enzyme
MLRIDHTAISVPDLDTALAFYCDVLGFALEYRADWRDAPLTDRLVGLPGSAAKSVMLKLGPTRIELFEYQSPRGKVQETARPVCDHGYTHICFAVADIQAEYQRLGEAGVEFHSAPVDFGPVICAYARDPFGNVFELKQTK